jgi:hypothetical protein
MTSKQDLNLIKELVELEIGNKVKANIAEKPGWLLLKTLDKMKTFGCVRLNKNSFVTLYIDTKEDILLSKELLKLKSFNNVDIKSRQTGNFVQNKIKLVNESQVDLIMEALNYVFNQDIVKTEKRIRHISAESIVA